MNSVGHLVNQHDEHRRQSMPISPLAKSFAIFYLFLTILITGCWAPPIKPTATELSGLQSILIVPVESPPLEVIPDLLEQYDPAYRHFQNMNLAFPAQNKIYQTPGGITVTGHVIEETDIEESDIEARKTNATDSQLSTWSPEKTLALQVANLLTAENFQSVLSPKSYRLPLADDERGPGLQPWWNAIQDWYALEQAPINYHVDDRFDAILELGIGEYRVFEGQILLQVLLKLIDPVSYHVIARTRDQNFTVDEAAVHSLARDGAQFKQLISELSVPLLRQSLRDIGLQASAQAMD